MKIKGEMNMDHLGYIERIAEDDCESVMAKESTYRGSWKRRGGAGAFHMLARKWDRLESMASDHNGDILAACALDMSGDDGSPLAEVRDLRRYLLLVEAEACRAREEERDDLEPSFVVPPPSVPSEFLRGSESVRSPRLKPPVKSRRVAVLEVQDDTFDANGVERLEVRINGRCYSATPVARTPFAFELEPERAALADEPCPSDIDPDSPEAVYESLTSFMKSIADGARAVVPSALRAIDKMERSCSFNDPDMMAKLVEARSLLRMLESLTLPPDPEDRGL